MSEKREKPPADLPKDPKLSPEQADAVKGGMRSMSAESCKETADSGMMGCVG